MAKLPYLGIYSQVLASNLIMLLPRNYVANINLDDFLCCGEIHFNVIWLLVINIKPPTATRFSFKSPVGPTLMALFKVINFINPNWSVCRSMLGSLR